MQLLWYQLALGLFRSLVVLFRPLRAPPISRLCHHPALADLMQLLWYQCYRTPMRLGVRACLGFGWTHHAGGPTVRVA